MTGNRHLIETAGIFGISAQHISPVGNGWINDTYKVTGNDGRNFILQRINDHVFRDVELLQNNISRVTGHLRNKYAAEGVHDLQRKVLTLRDTVDGKLYHFDGKEYWRVYDFIENAYSPEKVDEKSSYMAGKAFGKFQSDLTDIKGEIKETIPDFHNMEFRLKQFHDALAEDRAGRAASVRQLIDKAEEAATRMTLAERLFREGKLPKRICHCDTKVNNMMFDRDSNEFLCIIDLDTVMPAFLFSDTGDFLRTAANSGAEDEPDTGNVNFLMPIFSAFIKGYLESAGTFITDTEKSLLPYGTALFPYMQAVRFLTDYLNGDTYYKIKYPEHNLVRSRAQFKLFESVEKHYGDMEKYISGL